MDLVQRSWYNPSLRSQNAIIPGIIAIVMIVIAAMLTSVTVAREWETGTMEQLISTPLRGPELIFGKVIPYFVIGMTDVGIAVVMGKWLFNVPIVGNAGLVFAMAAIFLTGALFLGMTLSIVLKSQVLANQIAIVCRVSSHPGPERVCLCHREHAPAHPVYHLYCAGPVFYCHPPGDLSQGHRP